MPPGVMMLSPEMLALLTVAYAAFANQGEVPRPYLIRRVEDRSGEVLFSAHFGVMLVEPDTGQLRAHRSYRGDTNFMTAVAEARVLPESLRTSYEKLRAAWPQ